LTVSPLRCHEYNSALQFARWDRTEVEFDLDPYDRVASTERNAGLSRRGKILWAMLAIAAIAVVFVYNQVDIATKSIQFDLRKIGESVYEAHSKSGKWPVTIADLEGTEYLGMPYRKTMLEHGVFVVVWHQDLDPDPEANRDPILAYDNGSLLSRFGRVWGCRGDLRIERIGAEEVAALKARRP
jgi:hypothetical protein